MHWTTLISSPTCQPTMLSSCILSHSGGTALGGAMAVGCKLALSRFIWLKPVFLTSGEHDSPKRRKRTEETTKTSIHGHSILSIQQKNAAQCWAVNGQTFQIHFLKPVCTKRAVQHAKVEATKTSPGALRCGEKQLQLRQGKHQPHDNDAFSPAAFIEQVKTCVAQACVMQNQSDNSSSSKNSKDNFLFSSRVSTPMTWFAETAVVSTFSFLTMQSAAWQVTVFLVWIPKSASLEPLCSFRLKRCFLFVKLAFCFKREKDVTHWRHFAVRPVIKLHYTENTFQSGNWWFFCQFEGKKECACVGRFGQWRVQCIES